MFRFTKFLAGSALALFCLSCQKNVTQKNLSPSKTNKNQAKVRVIYGDDNRKDLAQVTNTEHLTVAKSTIALVEKRKIHLREDGSYGFSLNNFGDSYGLCPEEPFREQGTLAFCSGFLVGDDLIATAGHCISDQVDCDNTALVFDFAIQKGTTTPTQTDGENVYFCKEVLASESIGNGRDYALIRLDRVVTDRQPLRMRKQGSIKTGDGIVVIGHPAGLPTKVADGANVRTVNSEFFIANLDTYGGNSGSAVFNANTLEVEGVLVRGEMDFRLKNNCRVSNHCENNTCRGEDVTKIDNVIKHFPKGSLARAERKNKNLKKRIQVVESSQAPSLRKTISQMQQSNPPWRAPQSLAPSAWTPLLHLKETLESDILSGVKPPKVSPVGPWREKTRKPQAKNSTLGGG